MAPLTHASAFNPIVTVEDGHPVTTSLEVARIFGKSHDDVLRRVRNLLAELPSERARNFAETFIDVQGPNGSVRQSPFYRLTRDGFTVLAMGFTGKKALAFKLAYIDAFNRMEAQLRRPAAAATDAERVLTDSAYRLEAQQFAQSTLDQYRALLPAGVPAPAWDLAAERRLADGLLAAALGANRWLMSVDHNQRLQLSPVPRESAVIDPKNPEAMATIMNEYVPVELLPQLVQIGVERLARLARQAGKADGRALIPQRDHNPAT